MKIGKFTLVNEEKVNRAIHGSMGSQGQLHGGVGENAKESEIIAEYDRLGGLILQGKNKVKIGSFWDFKKRIARGTPEVVFIFRDLDGEEIEIGEEEEIPMSIKAATAAQEKKLAKARAKQEAIEEKKAKNEAKRGKKVKGVEPEEDEEVIEEEEEVESDE